MRGARLIDAMLGRKAAVRVYVFVRADGRSPVEFVNDDDAVCNAVSNRAVERVEDLFGRIVWQRK
jgi:hypothetical protein